MKSGKRRSADGKARGWPWRSIQGHPLAFPSLTLSSIQLSLQNKIADQAEEQAEQA